MTDISGTCVYCSAAVSTAELASSGGTDYTLFDGDGDGDGTCYSPSATYGAGATIGQRVTHALSVDFPLTAA